MEPVREQILNLQHISYTYHTLQGETLALSDISFSLKKGEFAAIVGPSGCGKSTLLSLICGLLPCTEGQIKINGKPLKESTTNVGYMLQHDELFEWRTIYNNVILGLEVQHALTARTKQRAHELLDIYGLGDFKNARPSELSGGMRQRAALIRTLVLEPELLLLDEPFSALDGYLKDILQRDMQNFLKDYKGDMIMVTHSRDEAYKFCSQLTLLNNGKDILTGETRDIFENPQYLEAARLTGCKNFSAVQKMGSHEVYALDWELMLRSEQEVTEDITHVGIRGHWMRPATKAGENTMEVQVEEYIENTFEHQYLFRNKGAAESGTLWWMCQKKNFQETAKDNIPKYLIFPPEHVMLLKK